MKAIRPYTQIFDDIDGQKILKKLEVCGMVCYPSDHKIKDDSAEEFVSNHIRDGHEDILDHASITVKFVVDRKTAHKISNHPIIMDPTSEELSFIIPHGLKFGSPHWKLWKEYRKKCEIQYKKNIEDGMNPNLVAFATFPEDLCVEAVKTATIREWRNFFVEMVPNADPQMKDTYCSLLDNLKTMIPVVFDNIIFDRFEEEGENNDENE